MRKSYTYGYISPATLGGLWPLTPTMTETVYI